MSCIIILPNQLFEKNSLLQKEPNATVYLVEHPVFYNLYKYHKLKLILHRASMKYYEDFIKKKYKSKVKYIEFNEKLSKIFSREKGKDFHMFDPVDHLVIKDIKKLAKRYNCNLHTYNTPLFISKIEDLEDYAKDKEKHSHSGFYTWQRKRLDILVTNKDKPYGGKWSYDIKNRKPFPDNFKSKYNPKSKINKYIKEAKKYIIKNFKNNPGNTDFYLPIDHSGAKSHYQEFLKNRFKCFGPYQDAVDKDILFGCHSVISPLLNVGLLIPEYVVREAEEYGKKKKVPLQSLEGFIRQVVGWREFTRMVYMFKRVELEKKNHFNHRRKLSKFWFDGESESTDFPFIDDIIKKVFEYGYLHHIERLMYIGNFMLITKIYPDDAFKWFMELSMDSYNWVMYSNVYGMSQHSAGPIMMNRPYFSSSSYIDRMSSYKKHKNTYDKIKLGKKEYEWFDVWDALYYNFISENIKEFSKNYATAAQVKHWKNKSSSEKKKLRELAEAYMKKY